jgi:hypothetical protein
LKYQLTNKRDWPIAGITITRMGKERLLYIHIWAGHVSLMWT